MEDQEASRDWTESEVNLGVVLLLRRRLNSEGVDVGVAESREVHKEKDFISFLFFYHQLIYFNTCTKHIIKNALNPYRPAINFVHVSQITTVHCIACNET